MALTRKQRERGRRPENRHERRQQQHAGGSEWECLKIPEGVKVFKPEAGKTYHMDILPYIVGDRNKNADKGDEYFELSYPVYSNIGLENKRFVAIGEMLGIPDPIAEQFAMLRKQGAEWDDMKMFRPTWRQIFLVFVHEESENGLQFFEGAYGAFGELLDEELAGEEADHIDNFDDPEHGSTLEVRFKAKNIGKTKPWILASKINFLEREDGFTADGNKKLAAAILDQVVGICLDDCLKIADYITLKAALDGRPTGISETTDTGDREKAEKKPATNTRKTTKKEKEPEETETPSDTGTEESTTTDDDWNFPDEPQKGNTADQEEDDLPFDKGEQEEKGNSDPGKAGSDSAWDEDW